MVTYYDVFDMLSYDAQRAIEDHWEDAVDEAESNAKIDNQWLISKINDFEYCDDAWQIHNDLGHPGRVDMCNELICSRQFIGDMLDSLIDDIEAGY